MALILLSGSLAHAQSTGAQYKYSQNLTIGSTGPDVIALQQLLINKGFLTSVSAPTGYFRTGTQSALARFQAANGISPASGYLGPKSRAFLNLSSVSSQTIAPPKNMPSGSAVNNQGVTNPPSTNACSGTLCNGTCYSSCPAGQDFVCPQNGGATCQFSQQQQQAQYQQQAQATASQAQARYQAQYQAVQGKIKPLQDQYNALDAIFSSQACSGLSGAEGEQGTKCLLASQQAGDVAGYESAIQGDFLTPVTDMSIIYENKLDALQQQIFQVKMDYHQQIANIADSGTNMSQAQGEERNALAAANIKIDALNQQIQQVRLAYQNGIAP